MLPDIISLIGLRSRVVPSLIEHRSGLPRPVHESKFIVRVHRRHTLDVGKQQHHSANPAEVLGHFSHFRQVQCLFFDKVLEEYLSPRPHTSAIAMCPFKRKQLIP